MRNLIVLVVGLFVATAIPASAAGQPKAYIGLFKDDGVAVVDTANWKVLKTVGVPPGPHGLVVTPDGRRVYVSSDGASTVSVIDTGTDEIVDSIEVGATPHGLAMTPDGSEVLVAGFGTDRVMAIDTSTDQVTWQATIGRPHNIAISPSAPHAYVASQAGSGALVEIDLTSGAELARLPLDKAPRALSVSPDGSTVLFTQSDIDAVQVLDTATNQVVGQVPVGGSPHHPVFTADGLQGMVVSQTPGTLDTFDIATRAPLASIKVGTMPHWIGLAGGRALVTNEGSDDLSIVDLGTNYVENTLHVGSAPRKIVVQP
jgi:YVTN family beta-propeller protein